MPKKVLVVDDDDAVRCMAIKALELRLGAQVEVVGAASGAEALALFGENPSDMIITDIDMAGMNGLVLLEKVQCLKPDIAYLVMSGYWDGKIPVAEDHFLAKPFATDDLVAEVCLALNLFPVHSERAAAQ